MELRPYNGLVIGVSEERTPTLNGSTMGNRMWTSKRYNPADYDHAIADLRATPFKRFTDNFIQVESMPGDVDLFDPEWDSVLHNIKILARVAKQGGCVGLEIDPEEYGYPVWTYEKWPADRKARATQDQYIAQARLRGRQFMQAINSEFPSIKILFLFGPTITSSSLARADAGKSDYRLLLPFIDGMCQTADTGTQIIDGFEFSYGYRTLIAFQEARKRILAAREYFEDKAAFDRVLRVGFGLWTDYNSGKLGWHPTQPDKNHFTPDTWQTAIYGALSYSDQYVWCWREQFSPWSGKNHSPDYEAAQFAGRRSPGSFIVRQQKSIQRPLPRAAAQPNHDDASTFGPAPALYIFPTTGWLFRPDPTNIGEREKWFSSSLNPEPRPLPALSPVEGNPLWSPIEIGKFWEEQGWDYDGVAWYRFTFTLPSLPAGKPIHLLIGSADESATVYLNGQPVGTHDLGETGWDRPFSFNATPFLHPGQNQITIRVLDRTGPGGLWKGIRLVVREKE